MQERIKTIRKKHQLTQTEFGEKIHVKGNTIANYECGLRSPSDAIIAAICREFNVREEWLREGIGPMEPIRSREEEIMFLLGKAIQENNKNRMALLSVGLQLSQDQVDLLADIALQLAAQLQENENAEKEPES